MSETHKNSTDASSSAFEYNPVPWARVESVEMTSVQDSEYRQYIGDLVSRKSKGELERERLIANNRTDFEQFKADANVWTRSAELFQSFLTDKWNQKIKSVPRVCGNCSHHRDDKYKDSKDAIVCWENTPADSGNRPRKLTVKDSFAEECENFLPLEEDTDADLDFNIIKTAYKACENGSDRHGRGQEYYAKRVSWIKNIRDCAGSWNKQRAEAFLRDLECPVAEETSDHGEGGIEFEDRIREFLSERVDKMISERVFKIHLSDGDVLYKEADVICEISSEKYVLEVFTERDLSEKRKQLSEYVELYERSTGSEAKGVLLTDKSRVVSFDLLSEFTHELAVEGRDNTELTEERGGADE